MRCSKNTLCDRVVHSKNEHPVAKEICPHCGEPVTRLTRHIESMHAEKTLQCTTCSKMFPTERSLKEHQRVFHDKKQPCPHCGKEFAAGQRMEAHIQRSHVPDNMKKYQCKICDPVKGFIQLHAYKDHMNIHAGLTPYSKCN